MNVCRLCWSLVDSIHRHHTSYEPERIVEVCASCHGKIEQKPGFNDHLQADNPRPEGYETGVEATGSVFGTHRPATRPNLIVDGDEQPGQVPLTSDD